MSYDKALSVSIGEAIDALHCCDAEAWAEVYKIRDSIGSRITPDPVAFLEAVERVIIAAGKVAHDQR